MSHGRRVLLLLAAFMCMAGPAGAAPLALSYQQFTSLNLGGDDAPVWSHDGTAVYYSTRATGFPYVFRKTIGSPMNTTGARLTNWTFDEYQAAISADDQWVLLCVGDTVNARHLWRCPSTGGDPLTKVTYGPFYDVDPDWIGSGNGMVAFASNRGGAGFQIWTLVPNGILPGGQLTQVTDAGHNDAHPSFSPDGTKIVFSSDRGSGTQLFVTTWNGSAWGAPIQLTTGGNAKQDPDWSADGMYLAYSVTTNNGTEVWIVQSDGTGAQLVTAAGSYDARPSWSSDGNHLAFVSDRSGAKYIWLADGLYTPTASDTWGRVKALYRR